MQSGVAATMEFDEKEISPKHLRVGINSALVTEAAIARLLIEKGVFSEEEYVEAVRVEMEREVQRYEKDLSRHFGTKVSLG